MTKTSKLYKTEIDGATDTAQQVELSAEEIAELELRELQAIAAQEAVEAEVAAKAAAKASAMQKLSALGLDADEIAALVG